MRIYHLTIPGDEQEFLRLYAGILWYEERLMNLIACAVNQGFWGKK